MAGGENGEESILVKWLILINLRWLWKSVENTNINSIAVTFGLCFITHYKKLFDYKNELSILLVFVVHIWI